MEGVGVKEHLCCGFAIKQVVKHIHMFLNNLLKVGSGIVKVSVATVRVATPLVGTVSSATVKFARREVALGKQEATIQSTLIKEEYAKMQEVTAKAKANIMSAFSDDLFAEEEEVVIA
tara:strand:- start:137 stop:490 length:354 start_codon:yes stop_codon:yes gene_type:complete